MNTHKKTKKEREKTMFTLIRKGEGYLPAAEFLPGKASESYTLGEALVLSAGSVTACGDTQTPQYIAMESITVPESGSADIYVMPVAHNAVYRTTNSAALTTVPIGSKVTLANAVQVTATTTSGVATIVYKSGDAAGSEIHVKF